MTSCNISHTSSSELLMNIPAQCTVQEVLQELRALKLRDTVAGHKKLTMTTQSHH